MERNKKVEDYMKVIYRLREKGIVRGAYIARELGVTKPTVSVSLKEMQDGGYVTISPGRHIELTQKGEAIAENVLERHRIIYTLLTELGVDKTVAEQDACGMEHSISEESVQALAKLRDYLAFIRDTPLHAFQKDAAATNERR